MSLGIPEIIFLLGTVFWIWMIVDCVIMERSSNEKVIWILILIFTHVLGALIYFFVRKRGRVAV